MFAHEERGGGEGRREVREGEESKKDREPNERNALRLPKCFLKQMHAYGGQGRDRSNLSSDNEFHEFLSQVQMYKLKIRCPTIEPV